MVWDLRARGKSVNYGLCLGMCGGITYETVEGYHYGTAVLLRAPINLDVHCLYRFGETYYILEYGIGA